MGGAGWSLKGPQPRLQESLASSCTPLTYHSPPPLLLFLPAFRAYWPTLPGLPLRLWGVFWASGYHFNRASLPPPRE